MIIILLLDQKKKNDIEDLITHIVAVYIEIKYWDKTINNSTYPINQDKIRF